jgi:hypothetical protein
VTSRDTADYLEATFSASRGWYDGFTFLKRETGQYDVILADPNTSNFIPAFGGKVVAVTRFLAFVPDYAERSSDVAEFFGQATSPARREAIAYKYSVQWILADRGVLLETGASLSAMRRMGRVAFEDRQRGLVLIRL